MGKYALQGRVIGQAAYQQGFCANREDRQTAKPILPFLRDVTLYPDPIFIVRPWSAHRNARFSL
jgi:hypothetical protein